MIADNLKNIGLVSIITPVYNAEKFLEKSIGSVIDQSYEHLELLLVNDGSTDSSEAICQQYSSADKRIKVVSQANSGPAAARNTGLRHATGEYIFFLDADDFIVPDALEKMVKAYSECQPDLVMCNFSKQINAVEVVRQRVSFSPLNEPFEGNTKQLSSTDLVDFVRHFLKHPSNHLISYCWARLYKASIIKEKHIASHEEMRLFEDFVLNLEYISLANNVVFLNDPLYVYVMHGNHISASMAIVNSDSLLHDMRIFKEKAGEFLRLKSNGTLRPENIAAEIGHALIHYIIIFLVRTCRQVHSGNRRQIQMEIKKLVEAQFVRECLKHYTPQKGNSRIVPLLMKLRLVDMLMSVCRYKANKRYGTIS